MKAALEGVPPAGLPSGVWSNADTPVADAPPPAPLAPARRPLAPSAEDGAPLPPAAIPNVGDNAPAPRAPRDRNLLEKLFGGA